MIVSELIGVVVVHLVAVISEQITDCASLPSQMTTGSDGYRQCIDGMTLSIKSSHSSCKLISMPHIVCIF